MQHVLNQRSSTNVELQKTKGTETMTSCGPYWTQRMNCKAKEVLPFFLKTKDNNNSQAFKTKKKLNLVCKKLRKQPTHKLEI